ncbi:Hsp70 family protein, partial [Kitasatospora purpeofusca]|uniref:Hsp70 family protein n=1 Tax=Kitasatospora purpeofusca TaxID=67352 RepID=UPI00365E0A84
MGASAVESVLAVDFGTTTTCAALARGGTVRRLREPAGDGWAWPSAVLLAANRPYVGSAAEQRRLLDPAGYRDELKRTLGRGVPVDLGGRGHPAGLLVSLLLQAVRAEAERVNGGPVDRSVLTVPAAYGPADPRGEELLDAARRAGLPGPELCPEPVAGALAPLAGGPLPPGSTVLVHDLGGGTFDTALVRLPGEDGRPGPAVLAHDGEEYGGRDFDALVYAELLARGGPELTALLPPEDGGPDGAGPGGAGPGGAGRCGAGPGDPLSEEAALRHRIQLLDLARRLKHRLAAESDPAEVFAPAGCVLGVHRDRFLQQAEPLYARTTACCARLLAEAALLDTTGRPPRPDAVVVLGGSSRLPGLVEHVAQALGLPVVLAEDPRTAVAEGAAAWAAARAVRTVEAVGPVPERTPLRWPLPPGGAVLVEWSVGPGSRYPAGAVLGRARAADGSLLQLSAPSPGRGGAGRRGAGGRGGGGGGGVAVAAGA